MNYLTLLVVALTLPGCAHQLTLMSRDGNSIGSGAVPGTFSNSGKITVTIDETPYNGTWVYSQSGGGVGLMQTYGATGMSTSTGVLASTSGIGNVIARSDAGQSLRCEFQYSEMTATGLGICQRADGTIYDLQIR